MATVLFVMKYPLHRFDNLCPKFDGQMEAARKLGHETRWLGWDDQGVWLMGGKEKVLLQKSRLARLPGYEHTFLFRHLMTAVKKAVEREPVDLVYMRYMPTFSNAPRALARAKALGAKLIVEHPTYPFDNGKKTSWLREPVFQYVNGVFSKIVPLIDLYTLIGEANDGTLDGRPAMNIANGVEAERFPLHKARRDTEEIGLLALASMTNGQGYDRLLRAMAGQSWNGTLYMAGGEGDGSLAQWKALAQELGVDQQVRFLGQVHGPELDALVERCDLGIGGLGMYRVGQFCSRTLKLREYMARGLPFVYAVDDPDMPEEPRFCRRIPND